MTDETIAWICLALAVFILPACFMGVCIWLLLCRSWWFDFLSTFILFGTAGGWAFAISMSPSGISAVSIIFLITIAVAACLISSIILTFRESKTKFQWLSLAGGYLYPIALAWMVYGTD